MALFNQWVSSWPGTQTFIAAAVGYIPSFKFNNARNSAYVALISQF